MKSTRIVRPLVVLLASAFSLTAQAVPITYSFSGTIDYLSYGVGQPAPFDGVRPPFHEITTGSFTIDADYLSDASTQPHRTVLLPTASQWGSFELSVNNFAPLPTYGSAGNCNQPYSYVTASDNNPDMSYPAPQPGGTVDQWQFSIRCTEQIAPGIELMRNLYIELNDTNPLTPDLMNGLDPLQLFDLALASSRYASFGYVLTDASCTTCTNNVVETWNLGVALTSLTQTPPSVPEPATAMLLMAGLTGCFVARRRRSPPVRS